MTPLEIALRYAARGWPVFPCRATEPGRKRPLTGRGFHDASRNTETIRRWWTTWPDALIGVPTGEAIGAVVLDIDTKDPAANGFDTLEDLGHAILPETPMSHTGSGGLHLYFAAPDGVDIRNTGGTRGRGIGPGLDWRGQGGYVIAPSPGSGYRWDPIWNFDTAPLAPVPPALLPRPPEPRTVARPVKPTIGLSPYAEAALDKACRRIIAAPAGEQETTINAESFAIGTLAGTGAVPAEFARRALLWAAREVPDRDPRRPWRAAEIEHKVNRAFAEGLRHPREAQHA